MPNFTLFRTLAALAAAASLIACASPPPAPAPIPSLPPAARPPAGMTISVLPSGFTQSSAANAFQGGGKDDKRIFVTGAILVDHPKGRLLFDAGYGRDLAEHFKTAPLLIRMITKPRLTATVADQLTAAGVSADSLTAIVLTHAHWDHVSGLDGFPRTPVWVTRTELAFVKDGGRPTRLARQLGTANYRTYDFADGPYLGFPRSWDVFDDGSVVLVPAPGHTPGSIAAFINTPDGKHYVLVGDTAWQAEGVNLPAQKPWLSRVLVDDDGPETWATLQRLHAAKLAMPDLIVVPAHDDRVWKTLPRFERRPAAGG